MTKTIIAPVVAFLIVAVKVLFGIEIPDEIGGQVTDAVVLIASLATVVYGIFKNHQKQPEGPDANRFPR